METYLRADWAVKLIVIVAIGSVLFHAVSGANITVGGSSGWDLTSDLQAWTAETPFHVGDSLVFSYAGAHDVLEVHEEDYESCNISHPIKTHNDGDTVVPLNQQGTRYFVCGRQGHCLMGQKLQVHVLPPFTTRVDDGADTDSAKNPDRRGGGGGRDRGRRQPRLSPTPSSPNNETGNQPSNPQDPDLSFWVLFLVFAAVFQIRWMTT
ncbi:blue copper protein-like [Humulus lupulus]|uniref:blue copper protein-like n=1 Tax=Humulus lupulus TaxID=3486 RepID=UPI002B402B85|nr:blue copper protein-like [Humulus lupulus]